MPLLTTKICLPPLRPNAIRRPRLVEQLNEGLRLGRQLTVVSAPAGFGKTTLASEWLAGWMRAAWLALDEGDNDPVQFLHYLVAALQRVDGRLGQTTGQVLQSPQPPPLPGLVTLLINDIIAAGSSLTLVLDDYHLISAPAVQQILQFLLEHQPPLLHLVICTRETPAVPLPRLRAHGQVTELRAHDLRFTTEEAALFFRETMGLALSTEVVAALESRTEGWVAGLQLAALTLQERHEDTGAFVAAFRGDNRYVLDYLVAEVLQRQPEAVRAFLRQTAILDQLTAPLCDAVTGREDSHAVLEQLEEANLFLVPLDQRREWYRYHRLFAESLRTQLGQEEQGQLHDRAMRWYEQHGFLSLAIHHALAYAAASGDTGAAERLIHLAAEETLDRGAVLTLRGWLESLPEARVRTNGDLATYRGWALALTGEMALAAEYADVAERCLHQSGAPAAERGRLLVLRAFLAVLYRQDYAAAMDLAAEARQMLCEDQVHWRIMALWLMAESQERTSNIAEAIATLREVQRAGRGAGDRILAAAAEYFLASALDAHGQRQEAAAVCQEAIDRYTDGLGHTSPMASLVCSQLGALCHEANQLEPAGRFAEQGRTLAEQLALADCLVISMGVLAHIRHARGESAVALEVLQQAHQLAAQAGLAGAEQLLAWEVNLRLEQGDLAFALRWAETAGLSIEDTPQYLRMEEHLTYGRVLLAQGRLAEARRWLARLERFAQERGLNRWLITVHILQALAAAGLGSQEAAGDLLARALEIAAPAGYVRAFLNEGDQVFHLLAGVRAAAPAFVDQLLAGASSHPHLRVAVPPLAEPLSRRELEVLRLVAAGLKNKEIALELVITPGTVKEHVHRIHEKLAVSSRTQAVARARELGLL